MGATSHDGRSGSRFTPPDTRLRDAPRFTQTKHKSQFVTAGNKTGSDFFSLNEVQKININKSAINK